MEGKTSGFYVAMEVQLNVFDRTVGDAGVIKHACDSGSQQGAEKSPL